MNPRRVHGLMRKHFPVINFVEHKWGNVADGNGPRVPLIEGMLSQHIPATNFVVEINRKVGGYFPKAEVLAFICENIGKGHIQIANREITSFVVVARNGVATSWQSTANTPVKIAPDGRLDVTQAARHLL